jgi:hypothetical protein
MGASGVAASSSRRCLRAGTNVRSSRRMPSNTFTKLPTSTLPNPIGTGRGGDGHHSARERHLTPNQHRSGRSCCDCIMTIFNA